MINKIRKSSDDYYSFYIWTYYENDLISKFKELWFYFPQELLNHSSIKRGNGFFYWRCLECRKYW